MAGAQSLEYNLAGLSLLKGSIKHADRLLETPDKVRKALRDQFAAYKHRFERASASELRNLLPNLDTSLRVEINELIELRNDLAHRYLRRTLLSDSRADYREQVHWLRQIAERFAATADRLFELMQQATTAKPPGMSDHQFALLQQLGAAAASGVSLDAALGEDVAAGIM